MGFFDKTDYTNEFRQIRKTISEQSDNTKEVEKAITKLEKGFKEVSSRIDNIEQALIKINSNFEGLAYVTVVQDKPSVDVDIVKGETKTQRPGPNTHISEYSNFKNLQIPRYYDIDKAKFYSLGTGNYKRYFNLTFQQLVAIINAYLNGLKVKQIKVNPILKDISKSNIQNYIRIWRAGGFNTAINRVARELNFNPDKLISHECDKL